MKPLSAIGAVTILGLLHACAVIAVADDATEQLFVRRIRPLLNEKCQACHGRDETKLSGDLDLGSRLAFMKGGQSELPLIVPGKPELSPLYLSITRTHDIWPAMPPKEAERLTKEQIAWVKQWIEGGAPWPEESRIQEISKSNAERWSQEDGKTIATSGGLSPDWTNRKYQPDGIWAYQPVRKPSLPESGARAIDALIARRIPEGLPPAPLASPREFLRRATFDLTGLPPLPEEIAQFAVDYERDAGLAVRKVVNRLLASPHYGERMAQHWLDVTRYADSSGFANDYERGNAWRYRDYVVRSFNNDKPFNLFAFEQIAGDENKDEEDNRSPEQIIATGFLRMGPWELTAMEVPRIARQRFLDDVVNSVGETFLAHSLQCARCHDHKFDPIPTRDYYSIQAVFATTQLAERNVPFLKGIENTAGFDERRYLESRAAAHMATLKELDEILMKNAVQWYADRGKNRARWDAAVEKARENRPKSAQDSWSLFESARRELTKWGEPEDDFPPKLVGFTPEQFGMERVARKGLERLRWELDRYEPKAMAVYSGRTPDMKSVTAPLPIPANPLTNGELETSTILLGGDPFARGPEVKPGILSVIGEFDPPTPSDGINGRRLDFARWVANENNPLTTRTIVNRVWQWHFGIGIAGNPNNFGSTGQRPTHPELLDWLAATLVEEGWSIKALHRFIMTSDTYRRASQHPDRTKLREKDPLGTSYTCFRPRRLTAEELRDAMLVATGELNRTMGGIPNRPEINLEAAMQPRQVMGTFAAAWTPNPLPQQRHRRSIYALKLRGLPDPAMEVFNAPASDFSCERREASTVTPQVFSLFNSSTSYARALALASRVLKEKPTNEKAAITRCFLLTYGRRPRADELKLCIKHWSDMEAVEAKAMISTIRPPLEVSREAIEENTGEKFSFMEQLPANADFVPDLQPADCDVKTRALADVCLALFNSNEFSYVD